MNSTSYFVNMNDFLCYSESNFVMIQSYLGNIKFRSENTIFSYVDTCKLGIFPSSLKKRGFSSKLFISALNRCFWGLCFGYFQKYRIKGLGHRIYINRNNFVYKIGYSHTVYKIIGLDLLNNPKRFKKQYYFALRGINNANVANAVFLIQSYRIPNCYCYNGIFVHGIIVEPKEGKKGFFL